ncbi:hypothetical protein TeGR_g11004 [Tetraparma gracilis]|uniref:S1 motif domain-containing protein n=1 Tax=Tetraparma gracilis TaxID=2962635 RepID=A0ABQ6MWF2_9STRA|nr:hypothetical protein TeGR_g11004 [Tetraparma gracilis]
MRSSLALLLAIPMAGSFVLPPAPRSSLPFLSSAVETSDSAPAAAAPTTGAPAQISRFDRRKKEMERKRGVAATDTSSVSFTYADFESLLPTSTPSFTRNDLVPGTPVQYENGGVMVDIGAKASAFLPAAEVGLLGETPTDIPLEEQRDFQIISEEDENGQLMVSLRRPAYRAAWDVVTSLSASDEAFEAEVVQVNRGGAICLVNGLRAFLPGSHLVGHMPTEALVGVTLPLKFLEVNQEANKLVVSNRRAVVDVSMQSLQRGDVVEGLVKAIKPYGAFVEVGGMSGLLHISQISYDRIEDLNKVFAIGDKLKCMIIDHDKVNGRIALSTKTLEPEPGDMLKDSAAVFAVAAQTAAKYHERMEAERKAREEAAKDIVLGLSDVAGDVDPLGDVTDSLEDVLGGGEKPAAE